MNKKSNFQLLKKDLQGRQVNHLYRQEAISLAPRKKINTHLMFLKYYFTFLNIFVPGIWPEILENVISIHGFRNALLCYCLAH